MEEKNVFMVSFSGGRTSAYMTDRLLKELPESTLVVCFANTGKEEPATLDFVHACDQRWGGIVNWLEYNPTERFRIVTYETASRKGEPFAALIAKTNYLPNVMRRICTQELKVGIIKRYMLSLGHRYWINVVGIRYDEPFRLAKFRGIAEQALWETWLPLAEWRITKKDVLDYWKEMPFDLNLKPHEGNCDLCFLKGRNKLKRTITENPEKAQWWIDQEAKVQATFHKYYSYFHLAELIRKTPTLFDYEDSDFECFCNAD